MIYGDSGDVGFPDFAAIAQSSNLYVYCSNNPLIKIDPTGFKESKSSVRRRMNDKYEIWGFIYGQDIAPTRKMIFGTHYVYYNGCELIAVYNARFQLGIRRDLSDIINDAETNNMGSRVGPWCGIWEPSR